MLNTTSVNGITLPATGTSVRRGRGSRQLRREFGALARKHPAKVAARAAGGVSPKAAENWQREESLPSLECIIQILNSNTEFGVSVRKWLEAKSGHGTDPEFMQVHAQSSLDHTLQSIATMTSEDREALKAVLWAVLKG